MRPNVGRSPASPQRAVGLRIDPLVSDPIANPQQPAAVVYPDRLGHAHADKTKIRFAERDRLLWR